MGKNIKINDFSIPMRLALKFGYRSIAWSLRRLHCPVSKDALVLEIGSGGNPYFRSNVLLDAYEETRERHWVPLVSDRPTVLGFAEALPFKDKSFDFVIASHVFEHTNDPESFLNEIQRVGKAGYIEVPDAFMERINPYKDHRLEITERNGQLIIRKKGASIVDLELVELYEDKVKTIITGSSMKEYPFHFHVRYYWRDKIHFTILNPETDTNWDIIDKDSQPYKVKKSYLDSIKHLVLKLVRIVFSQNKRNKNLLLESILLCPTCNRMDLKLVSEKMHCTNCHTSYKVSNNIPQLFPKKSTRK